MNVCDSFVDIKSSIHFCGDKTNGILFSRKKNLAELNIIYHDNRTKQYHTVEYLGGCLVANLS